MISMSDLQPELRLELMRVNGGAAIGILNAQKLIIAIKNVTGRMVLGSESICEGRLAWTIAIYLQ